MPGRFYVNKNLEELMFDELAHHCKSGGVGGFLPAVKQIANVACLPGIVNVRARRLRQDSPTSAPGKAVVSAGTRP